METVTPLIPEPKTESEMVTVSMLLTPDQAQKWLDSMPVQRRIRRNKIENLKRLVANGRWRLHPHGIVLDKQGQMIDGQHRCTLCIETGRSLPVRVTFNTDKELYKLIDSSQAPKSADDALHHEGLPLGISLIVAMLCRFLFRVDCGYSPLNTIVQPSNEEVIDTFYRHPDALTAAELARSARQIAPSLSGVVYYIYHGLKIDRARTRSFIEGLATGVNLRSGDPALLLRNTWYQERRNRMRREPADLFVQVGTCLQTHLKGKRMASWRGVEFGKGNLPVLDK